MISIICQTSFDITCTGTTGFFKAERLPFPDQSGAIITNQSDWLISRNKQRNFETLLQILGLRTQVFYDNLPIKQNDQWIFEFFVENDSVYTESSELDILHKDSNSIPMLIISENGEIQANMTTAIGNTTNIQFFKKR